MDKIQIAKELLKNTKTHYEHNLLKNYIKNINQIEDKKCDSKELLRLNDCINYIKDANFDITGWMLEDIPIFYAHCFLNKDKKEMFELAVWGEGIVTPVYLNEEINEVDADTIQEAIKNFNTLFTTSKNN